jgi:cyclopropane fatty-acyl-phospholipid synthase-like methyltransferase
VDRDAWLAERRAAVVARYDADAATYDADGYPTPTQFAWVARVAELASPGGTLLDAPCGTGRYFATVVDAGRRVVGADHSAGMLEQARMRGLADSLRLVSLQDLAFDHEFDGALTIDAMEHVPPEEWPVVLANLRRAVRAGAPLYVTIEEIDEAEVDAAFRALSASGEPAVRGELVEGDTGGYHYYPGRERVLDWLSAEGLTVVDETVTPEDGWAYRHLLLRAPD